MEPPDHLQKAIPVVLGRPLLIAPVALCLIRTGGRLLLNLRLYSLGGVVLLHHRPQKRLGVLVVQMFVLILLVYFLVFFRFQLLARLLWLLLDALEQMLSLLNFVALLVRPWVSPKISVFIGTSF